jgi:hypothetical protein
MSARLPDGYRVNLRADVRRYHDGRLLVGGSPLRAITLTDRATGLLDNDHITVRCAASRRLAERLLDANAADPNLDPALPDVSAMTVGGLKSWTGPSPPSRRCPPSWSTTPLPMPPRSPPSPTGTAPG